VAAREYLEGLFGLKGKAALVTGGSSGIGRELALGLAGAGASVVVSGRNTERLEETRKAIAGAGGQAVAVAAEMGDLESCRQAVDEAAGAFGGLDILVNCAGTNRRGPIVDVTPEAYDEVMAVNLKAPYFTSQAAVPHMRARGGGAIVHIASLTSSIGLAYVSIYGASKAGLAQLAKTQAIEWAPLSIRVNCLCPGFIVTPLTEKAIWGDTHKREWMLSRIPMGRGGRPEEMVGMAIYLCSPAASYMTGQAVYVDGGVLAGSSW
jgi:NAD(P)-dependent dehydrogenase (short-subunit alcohol dehydrogenase family)